MKNSILYSLKIWFTALLGGSIWWGIDLASNSSDMPTVFLWALIYGVILSFVPFLFFLVAVFLFRKLFKEKTTSLIFSISLAFVFLSILPPLIGASLLYLFEFNSMLLLEIPYVALGLIAIFVFKNRFIKTPKTKVHEQTV